MKISDLRQQPIREFTTSRGDIVRTYLTDEQAVKLMSENQDNLSNFGFGLVEQVYTKKGLTVNQWPWFHKLALDLLPRAARPDYVPEVNVTLDMTRIVQMFETAKRKLKHPRVTYRLEQGTVRLHIAGNQSRTPGAIMVTGDVQPDGTRPFYGRVNLDSTWEPQSGCPDWVLGAVTELAANPASYSKAYGLRYGHCCFCGLELTDGRSVAVGYGPICAENYGLPWGEVTTNGTPIHLEVAPVTEFHGKGGNNPHPQDTPDVTGSDQNTWDRVEYHAPDSASSGHYIFHRGDEIVRKVWISRIGVFTSLSCDGRYDGCPSKDCIHIQAIENRKTA